MLKRFISGASAKSSGQQRLNYIDQTHLVLASGKLVLQKIDKYSSYLSNDLRSWSRNQSEAVGVKSRVGGFSATR